MTPCQYCSNLRAIFERWETVVLERLEMVEKWHEVMSPEGKPAVQGTFFCDACGSQTTVCVELKDERDPADWWKG